MRDKILVNPASPEMKVRMPVTGEILPYTEKGTPVPRCSYWLRRIKDGDVVIVSAIAQKGRKESSK